MAEAPAEAPGRPMRYPYTFSAKIAQFPFKHYINNQWIWKYYLIAVGCCIPLFYKIDRLGEFLLNFIGKNWIFRLHRVQQQKKYFTGSWLFHSGCANFDLEKLIKNSIQALKVSNLKNSFFLKT